MNFGKKLLCTILALMLLLALALPAAADYPAETKPLDLSMNWKGKTILLHTNDVHGAIGGYAVASHMKQRLEKAGAQVLLIDAGDFSQGDTAVNGSFGASAVKLMNTAGYDLAVPGNHEFDYGFPQLLKNAEAAEFPIICADLFRDGELVFPADWTFTGRNGLKLGFFGLATPESKTKSSPSNTEGLTFLTDNALYDCAAAEVRTLRDGGADLVIALSHLGSNAESAPNRSQDLYANVQGIDLILDGHSHTVMTAGEDGEPIQSTGTRSVYIGAVVIDEATRTIEDRFLIPTESAEQDPVISAMVAQLDAEADESFNEVVGRSEVTLEGARAMNRTRETNHGDFCCDALRACILAQPETLRVDASHLIAIMNGGGIRDTIQPGDVTRRDVNTVLPFNNSLCVVYVTGAQLLEALEASSFQTPGEVGGFPQSSGLVMTIDTTKPYDPGELYPATTYHAPASIRRVNVLSVNSQPFSLTDTYAVACSDFIATGGDTYYAFRSLDRIDTGMQIDDVVCDYIRNTLAGVISSDYAAARGDITLITPENSRCVRSEQRITLDGEAVQPEAYNINGENYVKLRDLAMLLRGTSAEFAVSYDDKTNAVALTSGAAYVPVGGELTDGPDRSGAFAVSAQTVTADGAAQNLCAYNLAGNNFYRLRDLGPLLGFGVDYDAEAAAVVLSTDNAKAA